MRWCGLILGVPLFRSLDHARMRLTRSLSLVLLLPALLGGTPRPDARRECNVTGVFVEAALPSGAFVFANGEEVFGALVLVPAALKTGTYTMNVTREAANLYRVSPGVRFLRTSFCSEFVTFQRATLRYQSGGRGGSGTLVLE